MTCCAVYGKTSYKSASATIEEDGVLLYRFETESTVYAALHKLLKERAEWKETSHASHFNLLIGERWKIPYARLGQGTTLRQVTACSCKTHNRVHVGRIERHPRAGTSLIRPVVVASANPFNIAPTN
eukprot:5237806-Pyramimonas_sp.AAC.2